MNDSSKGVIITLSILVLLMSSMLIGCGLWVAPASTGTESHRAAQYTNLDTAILALSAKGGTLRLTEGTHTYSGTLTRAIDGVRIIGSGSATIISYSPADGNCIQVGGHNWEKGKKVRW